jgi:putative methylase
MSPARLGEGKRIVSETRVEAATIIYVEGDAVAMKRISLEIALQRRRPFPTPEPRLEQYLTPARLAADILYWALAEGDVADQSVLDLGCGTGIFAVGAALLGARESAGVDIDAGALLEARVFATGEGAEVSFVRGLVGDRLPLRASFDAVITNPPFGSQSRHADRQFVEAAVMHARVVYSIHLAETEPFVRKLYGRLGAEILSSKTYKFEIPHTYDFHRRERDSVDVVALRAGMVK